MAPPLDRFTDRPDDEPDRRSPHYTDDAPRRRYDEDRDDEDYPSWRERTSLLRMPLAGRGSRLAAALLDTVFTLLAAVPGLALLIPALIEEETTGRPNEPLLIGGIALLVVALLALHVYQWVLISTRGQSLGKRILKIRIVHHETGRNPGFGSAVVVRNWAPALIGAVPYVGRLFNLVDVLFIFSEDRRCIHDRMANTTVIEVRDEDERPRDWRDDEPADRGPWR